MVIWIDITNSPHVMFFEPIINSLNKKYKVIITARDYQQTLHLLKEKNIPYILLGKHHGKKWFSKIIGALNEIRLRIKFISKSRPDLTMSHQSFYATIAAMLTNRKSLYIFDGDATLPQMLGIFFGSKVLCPDKLPRRIWGVKLSKYQGIKEEIYLNDFKPDKDYLTKLGLNDKKPTILIRPEAESASYIKRRRVLEPLLKSLEKEESFQVIILPRTLNQKKYYSKVYKKFFIPDRIIDGPNIIANVNLVISSGGTMNREAVAIGTPVISAFQNPPLSIDNWLIKKGYMVLLKEPTLGDIKRVIKKKTYYKMSSNGKKQILNTIDEMLR